VEKPEADDITINLEKDGCYIEPYDAILSKKFWSDAKNGHITATGGIDGGAGRFTATVEFQYKLDGDYLVFRSTRYMMSGPPGYPNKFRANINIATKRGPYISQVNSPDAMWQDGAWHNYEVSMRVINYWYDPYQVGIEVDFDGPDGGGWFWTWKQILQPGQIP
jgi:hypothetical protein